MNLIEYKTFTNKDKQLLIKKDTIIKNCVFKDLVGNNRDGIQIVGNNITVKILDCTFDQSNINPSDFDEMISCINGPTVEINNCVFKNIGKTILCGNGDYPYSDEKTLNVKILNSYFINCSRRNPFFRYGKLYIKNCVFKNWGKTLYTKSHGIRLSSNAEAEIINCSFEMDKFIQCGFKNFLKDWINQFTFEMYFTVDELKTKNLFQKILAVLLNPSKTFKNLLPGACKGIICENNSKVSIKNCKKNKWWIFLDS